ncbi:MAG: hypothetical protein ACRELB_22285, partial [Polyangiaceae bacterium]
MKRTPAPVAFLAVAALVVSCAAEAPAPQPQLAPAPPPPPPPVATAPAGPLPVGPELVYPASRRVDQVDEIHGVRVADPYRWLEDGKSPEVEQWVAAQDGVARSYLGKLPLREEIAGRMKELLYVENEGTPRYHGHRLFYPRRAAGAEKYAV